MEKIILQNNIPLILKNNKNTPRLALCLHMLINNREKFSGEIELTEALLTQGTKTKSSEELAKIIEENGIECYVTSSKEFLRFNIICLYEDFEKAMEILKDIIFNSTFENFDKEKTKIKGLILSDLDSPQIKALDEFKKNIFAGHIYGNTRSVTLTEIDKTSKEAVKNFYNEILTNSQKNISIVGDFEKLNGIDNIIKIINNNFSELKTTSTPITIKTPKLNDKKIITKVKEDSVQAQILQGWIFPPITNEDTTTIQLMNTILGASGLSSRLFVELREKKGLAYTVRSKYDAFLQCSCFFVYIGTNPTNIQTAIDGFKAEINKLKTTLVSEEELIGGKNNIIGTRKFILETNIQQATIMGTYDLLGLGYNYEEKYQEKIKKVTAENIKNIANKYFSESYVLYALTPKLNIKL